MVLVMRRDKDIQTDGRACGQIDVENPARCRGPMQADAEDPVKFREASYM